MKKKKAYIRRTLLLILTGALLVGTTGCGTASQEPMPSPTEKEAPTPTVTVAPTETPTATPTQAAQTIRCYATEGDSGVSLALARVFQGMLNRAEARVWLSDEISAHGINVSAVSSKIVRQYGNIKMKVAAADSTAAHSNYPTFWALWRDYKSEVKAIYIFDTEDNLRDTFNIAAFLAGQNGGVAVTRELYAALKNENAVGDRTVVDVKEYCGFNGSTGSLDVNRWIGENLAKDAGNEIVFLLFPGGRGNGSNSYPAAYDTAVARGALIYWIDPTAEGATEVQASILSHFEAGTPVAGWSGLNVEQAYVEAISACGKSAVCIDWGFANGSVYGSFPAMTPAECTSPVEEGAKVYTDKVYVTFTVSDGDAWHYATKELLSYWENKLRGEYPVAWTVPSLFAEYHPTLLSYLYATRTENDSLIQGPSGEGYVYPTLMSDEDFSEFCYRTYERLKEAKINMVNYWDADDRYYTADNSRLVEFVETVEPDAVFLGHKSDKGGYFMIGNTVCMQEMGALNLRGTQTADEIVDAIDRAIASTPEGEPVFVAINVEAWGEGITTIDGALDLLLEREDSDRYEFVSAGTITGMIRKYLTAGDDGKSK